VLDIRASQLAVLSEDEQETFIELMRKLLISFEREPVGAARTTAEEG